MAINLDDHKMFIQDLGMEVVPYSIAVKAVQEAVEQDDLHQSQATVQEALKELRKAFGDVQQSIDKLND